MIHNVIMERLAMAGQRRHMQDECDILVSLDTLSIGLPQPLRHSYVAE
jgi:hypothetical protein